MFRSIADGAFLHLGDAARHGNHDATAGNPAVHDFLDEGAEYTLRDLEVRDDAVTHGTHDLQVTVRLPLHFPRIVPDGDDFLRVFIEGDDRWLAENHTFALDPDQRVCGSQVNGDIVGEKTEQTHKCSVSINA